MVSNFHLRRWLVIILRHATLSTMYLTVSYVPFVQGKKLTDPQTLQLQQYKIHEEENNSSFLLESQFC